MSYKGWVKLYLAFVGGAIALFALFNYAIDPLWTFCHSHRFNNAQPGFDERQQKTNRAYFCGLEKYDALLLGSSRTTYINQHDFTTMRVFNYASVSMYPSEYQGWIDVAQTIKGKPFQTVILGVDFFGSNDGPLGRQQQHDTPPASHYFSITTSPFYRYKMLLSLDTFRKSLLSLERYRRPDTTDYSRDNVKHTIRIDATRKAHAVAGQAQLYGQWVYGKRYRFNPQLTEIFRRLKHDNPHTRFVLFTTPISGDLFKMLVQHGNIKDYERWLRTLVDVFGEVYDFMGINSVTNDPSNYADLHHFYPDIGTLIVKRLENVDTAAVPQDFGIRITPDNIDAHLRRIRAQAEALLKSASHP